MASTEFTSSPDRLCACGCGTRVTASNLGVRFKKGHSLRVRGPSHPAWKSGWFVRNGYAWVTVEWHPYGRDGGKYIRRSRLVMEQVVGRFLGRDEHVHHINRNTLDDRPENLQIMTRIAHLREHAKERNAAHPRGENNPQSKLSEGNVALIRNLNTAGVSARELGRRFDVSSVAIDNLLARRTWAHVV
jgi:hypothetical protein